MEAEEHKPKSKNQVGLGTRLGQTFVSAVCEESGTKTRDQVSKCM